MSPQNRRLRLYIPAPSSERTVAQGLQWLSKCLGPSGRGAVIVPTVNHIRESMFGAVLGKAAKAVHQDRTLTLPVKGGSARIEVLSATQATTAQSPTAILMLWPSDKVIADVDRWYPEAPMLAVAWSNERAADWESRFGFTALGAKTESTQLPSYPVVLRGLEWLTTLVNLSTGIAHPSDREAFVGLLYALEEAREKIDPEFVQRALVELGWTIDHARSAGALATRFVHGTRPRRGTHSWVSPEKIRAWQVDAQRGGVD